MAVTLSSRIKFKRLCDVFEKIAKERAAERINIFKEFIFECRKEGTKLSAENMDADVSIFPILRLFLPQHDRERGSYNMKETLLKNLYIRVFCLGKSSKDAQQLINYKLPTSRKSGGSDFAETVHWVLRKRFPNNNESLTVDKINAFLDDISRTNKANNNLDELFRALFRQISALELKWLTRIILKDLRLRVETKKMLQVLHPRAKELFNITSDLQQICDTFCQDKNKPRQHIIQVFSFIKPMLLEACVIEDVDKIFNHNNEYILQMKFDGERSQIHMKNGVFKYSTRQRFEITDNWGYGKTGSDGFLTSKLTRLLNPQCTSIILDGELMCWHKRTNKMFSRTIINYDVKKLTADNPFQPCFVAFDIILYNDKVLVDLPYRQRLSILENAFQDEEGSIIKCKNTTVTNSEDVRKIFEKSIKNDEEGIVLKSVDCTYKPNVREGSNCYKIKSKINDIDLIILGGYYGEKKFAGLINSFMMGVAEMPENEGEEPTKFFALVSVSTGIEMSKLKELNTRLERHWIKERPACTIGPKKKPPDLWIRPENSLIMMLCASDITATQNYPLGYSLQFPRVGEIREDKPWYSACTSSEFLKLAKHSKVGKRQATFDDIETTSAVKPKKLPRTIPLYFGPRLGELKVFNKKSLEPITRLLDGKEICVINGNDELSKKEMEDTLLLHRAKLVEYPSKETYCVIVGDVNKANANHIIRKNKYDVVTVDWFKHVTKEENWAKLESFLPWHLLYISQSTKLLLAEKYDDYYDSFMTDADEESLQRSFGKASCKTKDSETFDQEQRVDEKLFDDGVSPFSIFRKIIGYFADCSDSTRFKFRFMGGIAKEEIDESVDYIFVENGSTRVDRISETSIKIINSKWIKDCFHRRELYLIDEYIVR